MTKPNYNSANKLNFSELEAEINQRQYDVTSEMRRAGAMILDDADFSFSQEEMAAAVYIAMEAERFAQKKSHRSEFSRKKVK